MFDIVKLGIVGAIVATLGWYVWDYTSAKEQVASLQLQLSERDNAIKVLQSNATLAKETIASLDKVAATRNADLEQLCPIIADIKSAPAKNADGTVSDDDQPVGGIIARALQKLKELKGQ